MSKKVIKLFQYKKSGFKHFAIKKRFQLLMLNMIEAIKYKFVKMCSKLILF